MKKFFALLCVLVLLAGFVAADDIGISVGLELGIGNINKANDEEMAPYLMPNISYGNSFLDGALDFSTELDYYFDFKPKFDGISDQYLDFNL